MARPAGLWVDHFTSVPGLCASAGTLRGQLPDPALAAADYAQFGFVIPASSPNLTLRRIQSRHSASAPTGGTASAQLLSHDVVLDTTAAPGVVDVDEIAPPGARNVFWRLSCAGPAGGQACTFPAADDVLHLHRARLTVAESAAPSAALDGGELLAGGGQRGARRIVVDAADLDSGVRGVTVKLGGVVAGTAASTCAAGGWAPCPKSLPDLAVAVDTTKVADGSHALTVEVEDTAGNVTTVSGPAVLVDNVAPPASVRAPSLSGAAVEGQELVLDAGQWDGHGRSVVLEYRWQRSAEESTWVDVSPSPGDATRYSLIGAEVGRRLRAVVRASSSEGTVEAVAGTTARSRRATPPARTAAAGPRPAATPAARTPRGPRTQRAARRWPG